MRLDRRFRILLYLTMGLLYASGCAWIVADAGKATRGDEAQAFMSWMLMLHGAGSLVVLVLFGAMLQSHVVRMWRARINRWSGGLMIAMMTVLAITAHQLYYAGGDHMRYLVSVGHIWIGMGLPLLLVDHVWRGRRKVRAGGNGTSKR